MTEAALEPTVVPSDEGPQPQIADYWGTDETHDWFFPDKIQFVTIKVMNEGDRSVFERMTSTDLNIDQRTQSTRVRMDQARDRHELLKRAIVGWKLYRRAHKGPNEGKMEELNFSQENLSKWLQEAPPKIIDEINMFIRKHNTWLHGDMTIEQIDEEIERLRDVRAQLVERDAGKGDS